MLESSEWDDYRIPEDGHSAGEDGMDRIIKDANGRPQGIIRQQAGGREVLLSNSGNTLAYYDARTTPLTNPAARRSGPEIDLPEWQDRRTERLRPTNSETGRVGFVDAA